MRLSEIQKKALFSAIENIESEVYLFGSRADDTKKGGDVDILIFSEDNPLELSLEVERKYQMICEEKIDVVVMDKNNLNKQQKAFLNTINKIQLK